MKPYIKTLLDGVSDLVGQPIVREYLHRIVA